jgi:hypothetical protein
MASRNFVEKNEGRLTVLQFIGFCVLILGVIGIVLTSLFMSPEEAPSVIAVTFFVTMLGFAFAFPTLLEGNEGLSTMRIIVFMITNIICMLLLKIGWAPGVHSLKEIGLDQYWMGVIAFVFGAKATQSFFESKMAVTSERKKVGMEEVDFLGDDLARLCIAQNEQFLKVKFPNILSISDSVRNVGEIQEHVIAIYVLDNNTGGLPHHLGVRLPDGTLKTLPTEIIPNVDEGRVHFGQKDRLLSDGSEGSICCLVKKGEATMAITAGHVYTAGESKSYGGTLDITERKEITIKDNEAGGKWVFQLINFKNDVGLVSIERGEPDANIISFKDKGHFEVTNNHVGKTKVILVSSASQNKVREAYILDFNIGWDIPYENGKFPMNKIILIGDNPDRKLSKSVSIGGDSGGTVYEPVTGKLVGLILGGNQKFTWVLPLKDVLNDFKFTLA